MLYRIFKFLFTLTVKGYFRSIYIKGQEHIPKNGPVIFAANHTSAFMDPIVLGVYVPRELYFLARGDVFKKKVAAKFFSRINMLPIYRREDMPEEMHKNEQIFEKCFEHLSNGKTILIFPEGISLTERRLRPIKTGAARIALGAEFNNNFDLNVQIVPIGINYSNPHHFRSDVFIKIGRPISVKSYQEAFNKDDRGAATQLTEEIKESLEKLVVIIEDDRLDKIIKQIEILYRSKLREEAVPADKAPQDFYLSKDIVRAVEFHMERNPKRIEEFEIKISRYLNTLKRLHIRDTQVRAARIPLNAFWSALYFIIGFPLFAYGYVTNYIPFKTSEFIVNHVQIREDFVGSIKMAGGMFIFLFLYLFEATLVGTFTNVWVALIFLLTLYPTGLFTISYIKNYYQTRGTLKYISMFLKRSDIIAKLKSVREQLVNELEVGRAEYDDWVAENEKA